MQMGEGARSFVSNQKQVHHFAVVRNERSPLPAAFRRFPGHAQDELITFGSDLCAHRQRSVELIISVLPILEIPPLLPAESPKSQRYGGQRHRGPATPAILF